MIIVAEFPDRRLRPCGAYALELQNWVNAGRRNSLHPIDRALTESEPRRESFDVVVACNLLCDHPTTSRRSSSAACASPPFQNVRTCAWIGSRHHGQGDHESVGRDPLRRDDVRAFESRRSRCERSSSSERLSGLWRSEDTTLGRQWNDGANRRSRCSFDCCYIIVCKREPPRWPNSSARNCRPSWFRSQPRGWPSFVKS